MNTLNAEQPRSAAGRSNVNRGGRPCGAACRPVIGTSITTGDEFVFHGATALQNAGFSQASVWRCLKKKVNQHGGFTWRYQDGLPVKERPDYQRHKITGSPLVIGVNVITGETIHLRGRSEIIAAGFNQTGICRAIRGDIKTHRGYKWSRKDLHKTVDD